MSYEDFRRQDIRDAKREICESIKILALSVTLGPVATVVCANLSPEYQAWLILPAVLAFIGAASSVARIGCALYEIAVNSADLAAHKRRSSNSLKSAPKIGAPSA
jgi:hypothetical protein